jgi:hypothetical protein
MASTRQAASRSTINQSGFVERLRSNADVVAAIAALDQAEVHMLTITGWAKTPSQGWTHSQISPTYALSRWDAISRTRQVIIRQQLLHGI